MRIWHEPEIEHQTVGFEMPYLPGETFRLVVPELVSDKDEPLLPWDHPSPDWDIDEESARCAIEISGTIRMAADVRSHGERIDITVEISNLSDRVWQNVSLFTCFVCHTSPLFHDPDLTRTYFPVDGKWKSVADMFTEHDPGDGPYTCFPVCGGPPLNDLWVCRAIAQNHPQQVSRGAACILSTCGEWVAGMESMTPAFVFTNRRERCIHANPLLGTIKPGETVRNVNAVHIFRGSLAEFDARLSDQ